MYKEFDNETMGKNLRCYGGTTDNIYLRCLHVLQLQHQKVLGLFDDSVITTKVKTALIGEKS